MLLIALLLATITTKADVPRITAAELQSLMAKGEAVAIDVRGSVPWKYGRIAGATWIPLGKLDERAAELPQDKLLVPYCTCKAEELSLEAAMALAQKHGFERVAVLVGGYPAWKDAGLPVEVDREVLFDQELREKKQKEAEARAAAEAAAAPATGGARGGRLAPPDAVTCDRNELTSYAGSAKEYRRGKDATTIVIATSAGTTETVTLRHPGTNDPSKRFLIEGRPFAADDWKRIESKSGVLHPGVSLIAWVCADGTSIVDWRPGVTFSGAE